MKKFLKDVVQCNTPEPSVEKNGILPFAVTWMDSKDIMLSEIS